MERPKEALKDQEGRNSAKTCMERLMWGQWVLGRLLRALFGQHLAAAQREGAPQPGCTLRWLHSAAAGKRPGTRGALAILSVNCGVIPRTDRCPAQRCLLPFGAATASPLI